MRKFPVFQQYDSADCGPTCLAMICAYYGKHYKMEHLQDIGAISKEGVSLYGISVAAETLGFHTVGVQLTLSELSQEKFLPCIIYWNQNHFVVLYKIKKTSHGKFFYVANPDGGVNIELDESEFAKCFVNTVNDQGKGVGVALYLAPTHVFYENKGDQEDKTKMHKSLKFFYSYLSPYKRQFLLLFVILILGTIIQSILPFLTQAIVDVGINGKNVHVIILILIGQLVMETGNMVMGFSRNLILLKTGTKVNISLISDYLAKMMRLSISFFDSKQTGDILQRISDHYRIQGFLTDSCLGAFFSVISFLVFGIVICVYNWIVSLIFFVGSALYVFWVWKFMKRRAILDNKTFSQSSANQSSVIQLVTGMQEIKLNGCEQHKRWEWEHIQRNLYRLSLKSLKLSQYQQSGGVFINQIKNLIITAFVATLVIKGQITLGMMLSIQYIVGMLNSPVDQLIGFIRQYQDAQLSLSRLLDVYDKDDEDNKDKINISDQDCGDIVLHDITFKYDKHNSTPNINNISLCIPHGQTTAIVGLSGSGKTTLLKLILGFYHLDNGFISIGSNRLDNMNLSEWRKKCGTVMQEGFIFSDTIARNIAPGVAKIDMQRVKEAAKVANIDCFIEDLPLKYDTKIGGDGNGLSIGQKQRILIARAVYKNPQYVFLDEATNSLDANNEKEIMEHLNGFIKGRTAVVIAHRLSTVKNADNIIVLENGKIAESGKHTELIRLHGIYYKLVKNQLDV